MPADTNPLHEPTLAELGIRPMAWRPGFAAFTLAIEGRHLNYAGVLHGGIVATLLDVACGYATMPEADGQPGGRVATISLAVNYLAGAPGGLVRAMGRRTGGGRRVVFCPAELLGEDGTLIATAQASMRVSGERAG